jgi:hypothetical protein
MRTILPVLWIGLSALALAIGAEAPTAKGAPPLPGPVPVGVAVVDITPSYPVRLTGYGSRKTESEGVENRLKAKALAIGSDDQGPCVLVAVDNCGVPAKVIDEVAKRLETALKLPRERFTVCSTHIHTGPALGGALAFMFGGPVAADQQARIDRYTRELTDSIEAVARKALAARAEGRLAWAEGSVAFAANRRVLKDGKWTGFGVNPAGPTDRRLPVLTVTDSAGKLQAVLLGYACHCTTLGGEFNKLCGDWAGYACEAIERDHPGATAIVIIGCGADANPEPRRDLTDAKTHGAAVAAEFARLLKGTWTPLPGRIVTSFRRIDLPFGPRPTRAELQKKVNQHGADAYLASTFLQQLDRGEALPASVPYPVQTWCFGDALAMTFLGGEVVVDYALRLYRECDAKRLWVSAYSNDVPCYIASRRILQEGGYEADSSMIYYGRPTRLAPEVEDLIISTVHDLLPDTFEKPAGR